MSTAHLSKIAGNLGLLSLVDAATQISKRLSSCPQVNATQSCLAVICLQLAAEQKTHAIKDLRVLHKAAGMTKKNYNATCNMVRSALGITAATLTVEEAALKLGCPELREKALAVLASYTKEVKSKLGQFRSGDLNIAQPLFPCAAVAVAAKDAKIKLDRTTLLQLASSTKKVLDEMVEEMVKIKAATTTEAKKKGRKRGPVESLLLEVEEKKTTDSPSKSDKKVLRLNQEEECFDPEEYQEWKTRILKEAGLL